ncbi:MAG: hypothetical protein M9894_23305 [Planctomycetes bacterium]|nr:hypothetical protein [Planctomycetota bacterium]
MNVTAQAPPGARLWAYLQERFPPGAMAVFSAVTALSAAAAAAAATGRTVAVDPGLALLAAAHLLTLLLLRVLDEHKDHDRDVTAYPERVLSRGVLTLPALARVGWAAGGLALLASAALGPLPLAAHALVLVFALLMAKEFFLGDLLRKDVFVYAAAHQPINPLITGWLLVGVAARGTGALDDPAAHLPATLGWYVGAQFALGFGFEVARKVWTPAEERPDLVDSYSSHAIGPRGAGALALVLLLGGCAAVSVFVVRAGLPAWTHAAVGLCALLCLVTVGRFAVAPFPDASKKLQGAVGLGSLVLHAGLVAGAAAAHGLALTRGAWGWGAGA